LAAEQDHLFPTVGVDQQHELVSRTTAHSAGVGLDLDDIQTGPLENTEIGIDHVLVGLIERLVGGVESVGIFHQEFAAPHQAEARADLIAEFHLNLVEVERKLPIAFDFTLDQGGDRFLVSAAHNHLVVVAIFHAHLLFADRVVAATFLPDLGRAEYRHGDFQRAGGVHLFAHYTGEFLDNPLHHRALYWRISR